MNDKKIAIFDSGVGGLTVLKEVKRILPNEYIVYFGDTKRVPYGPRPKEEIIDFSLEIVDFLLKKDIKIIVIACNTITSNAIREIEDAVDLPVIGVVEPGIRMALAETETKRIGLIGTEGTISSKVYQDRIEGLLEASRVKGVAAGELVEIAERGIDEIGRERALVEIEECIGKFEEFNPDTLILGCTHFPSILEEIKKYSGDMKIVDPAYETSRQVKKILAEKGILNKQEAYGSIDYYVSRDRNSFKRVGERIIKEDINNIFEVDL